MQTETSAHRAARRRRRGDVGPSRRGRGRPAARRYRRGAGAEGAWADPRRKGDDYPMTSLSDGLGPQKPPNSGRTRVESGPAGTHRPTTRRGGQRAGRSKADDEEQATQHQGRRQPVLRIEALAEGVERACPDVAVDDTERDQREPPEPPPGWADGQAAGRRARTTDRRAPYSSEPTS